MRIYTLGRLSFKKIIYLPIVLILYPLICIDLHKRAKGLKPDEWYWADDIICKMGWVVSPKGE